MINIQDFLMNLPNKVKPELIEGVNTLFHFDMEGQQFTVGINEGKISVEKGLNGEPKCSVKASQETLSKLLSGDLNPMMAMMTGKLKISNPGEMMKYAKILGLM